MKNSEWGAVAYLAYSGYGRNGNDVKPNLSSDMRAGGGCSTNGATYATTSESIFDSRYGYKTAAGISSSTTKNIYGVYDLVGGALEYVSSYINNDETVLTTNGNLLQNESTLYFAQAYAKAGVDTGNNNYVTNAGIYGDAIYEVSTSSTKTWGNNGIDYPNKQRPFFARGGAYDSNYDTVGIFEVVASDGAGNETTSFRIILVP